MDYGAAQARGEEKSRLILGQIGSIRSRLNALALQQGLFAPLTFILCAIVLILGAAFAFSAMTFLLLAAAVTVVAVAGVVRTAGTAWRMRASDERAARIADQRAALKGRLTTMVDAGRIEQRSTLWPYLVEDTLALRDEFAAARIEPRRVSRWLWAAIASCAVAAVAMRVAYGVRTSRLAGNSRVASIPGEPSVDLGDLDIRPADPSLEPGTEIDADPATLRKLAEKLREAQTGGPKGSPTSRLMANARDAAKALQNRLTGNAAAEAAPRLKLTDKKGGGEGKSTARSPNQPPAKGAQESQQGPQNSDNGQQQSDQNATQPNSGPTPGVPDMSGLAALNGLNNDDSDPNGSLAQNTPPNSRKVPQGGPMGAGGSNHGSGSDPRHLYGDIEKPPLGNDTFKIPVEVAPSEEGSSNLAPPSPPQRTRSALNASQAPDEPFERASIPASDRVTIKRVFER
jgi:membrane protein implicated in regulation of membrane protease activity